MAEKLCLEQEEGIRYSEDYPGLLRGPLPIDLTG